MLRVMLTSLAPHDHAILVYEKEEAMLEGLSEFTRRAVAQQELVVFVHAFPTREEAVAFLRRGSFDFASILDREFILLSFYRDAFEAGKGRIDFDHVVGVVDGLLATAKTRGLTGLGVYVDASRVYLESGRADEWFAFEERLGRRLHHAMALVCAYRGDTLREPAIKERALLAHQYRFGV
jgi:hypothetical protein